MKINEFIQEYEGCMDGETARHLYKLMCMGFINDVSVESCCGDVVGVMGHLVFDGLDFSDVTLTIENVLLGESHTFKFKLEDVSRVDPTRYRELD